MRPPSEKARTSNPLVFFEVKGKAKEAAGKITKNPDLTNKGQAEKLAGKVQTKIGHVKKVFER